MSEPWALLAERGIRRRYRSGAILMSEGEPGGSIFVICSGRVRVFVESRNGRELTLGIYGAGDLVGEMSLDGAPRSASVITMEPTECAIVGPDVLRECIAQDPEFAMRLLCRVIGRARLATESARSLALLDVYGRLALLLEELAVTQPDGSRIVAERITQQELASRIGASREMVSRILKDLTDGGYIRTESRRYVLLKALPRGW